MIAIFAVELQTKCSGCGLPHQFISSRNFRMPPTKRVLQETQSNRAKRVRLSAEDLEDLGKEELIAKVLELQQQVQQLDEAVKKSATKTATALAAPSGPAAMTDQHVAQKVQQARTLMFRGIRSQMKARSSHWHVPR